MCWVPKGGRTQQQFLQNSSERHQAGATCRKTMGGSQDIKNWIPKYDGLIQQLIS